MTNDREKLLSAAKIARVGGHRSAAERILLFDKLVTELDACVSASHNVKDGRFELSTAVTNFGMLINNTMKAIPEWNVGNELGNQFGKHLKAMREALDKIERGSMK